MTSLWRLALLACSAWLIRGQPEENPEVPANPVNGSVVVAATSHQGGGVRTAEMQWKATEPQPANGKNTGPIVNSNSDPRDDCVGGMCLDLTNDGNGRNPTTPRPLLQVTSRPALTGSESKAEEQNMLALEVSSTQGPVVQAKVTESTTVATTTTTKSRSSSQSSAAGWLVLLVACLICCMVALLATALSYLMVGKKKRTRAMDDRQPIYHEVPGVPPVKEEPPARSLETVLPPATATVTQVGPMTTQVPPVLASFPGMPTIGPSMTLSQVRPQSSYMTAIPAGTQTFSSVQLPAGGSVV